MKKLAVVLLVLAPLQAAGQSDYAVTWDIVGGLQLGIRDYTILEVDIDVGSRYFPANGALLDAGKASPLTGTCFSTAAGGIFCNFQGDQNSFNMNIASDLNGTLNAKDSSGNQFFSSTVLIKSVQ